jgi:Family of unknown function (DUF6427)
VPGVFRSNNPFSIVLLFFYGLILRYASFIDPQIPVVHLTDGFLYHGLLQSLENIGKHSPIIYSVISYSLVFIQALMLNNFVYQHRLLAKATYLPALSYILITALFPEWWQLSSTLIVNTFMIWGWTSMTDLYKNQRAKQMIFNIGIIIGISSFFYFPSVGFVLLLAASLVIMRPTSIPEWLVGVLGITTPYYFLFAWLYLRGNWNPGNYLPTIHLSYPQFQQTIWAWGGLLLLILPFLISGIYIQGAILRMLIQVRKGWSLLLVYLLCALLIPFINATAMFEYWILSAVPFAAFLSNVFFSPQKKLIPNLLHAIMLVFILALNYVVLKSS